MYLKNTANQHIPFALIAPNGTAVTGAIVAVKGCIDGGVQFNAAGVVKEIGNGQYDFVPSAADMNGDTIGFLMTATGAVPVHFLIVTTPVTSFSVETALNTITKQIVAGKMLHINEWNGAQPVTVSFSKPIPVGSNIPIAIYQNFGLSLSGDSVTQTGALNLGVLNNTGWTKDVGWVGTVNGVALRIDPAGPLPAGVLTIGVTSRLGAQVFAFNIPEITSGGIHMLGADDLLYRSNLGVITPVKLESTIPKILDVAYDPAKTAATQGSVDEIKTLLFTGKRIPTYNPDGSAVIKQYNQAGDTLLYTINITAAGVKTVT